MDSGCLSTTEVKGCSVIWDIELESQLNIDQLTNLPSFRIALRILYVAEEPCSSHTLGYDSPAAIPRDVPISDMEDLYHFEQAYNRVTYAGTLDIACRCQEISSYQSHEDTRVSSVRPTLRV